MIRITSLCNAGFAMEYEGQILLIDITNKPYGPYYGLPEETWIQIYKKAKPYDCVCGMYFTHDHPDHCNKEMLQQYAARWPEVPIFVPEENMTTGTIRYAPFELEYQIFPHAPMLHAVPPHVVTWLRVGEKSVYLAADAALDVQQHRVFLRGRKADLAIWNAMYLSRPETRQLLRETADRNIICHMPKERNDWAGIWKKCDNNFRRYGEELKDVTVLEGYPNEIWL